MRSWLHLHASCSDCRMALPPPSSYLPLSLCVRVCVTMCVCAATTILQDLHCNLSVLHFAYPFRYRTAAEYDGNIDRRLPELRTEAQSIQSLRCRCHFVPIQQIRYFGDCSVLERYCTYHVGKAVRSPLIRWNSSPKLAPTIAWGAIEF